MVNFRQVNAAGKASRPQILDRKGKTVSLSRATHATLMAMAPVLADRLQKLAERCEFLHMQLQSELAMNLAKPKELLDAEEACAVLRRILR